MKICGVKGRDLLVLAIVAFAVWWFMFRQEKYCYGNPSCNAPGVRGDKKACIGSGCKWEGYRREYADEDEQQVKDAGTFVINA